MSEGEDAGFEPIPTNPKVTSIVDRLVTAIAAGDFLPGSKLPSERDLARALSVGRNTLRSALQILVDRGLIEIRRGRSGGAFVLHADPAASRESIIRVFGADLDELRSSVDALGLGNALVAEAAALRRTARDLEVIGAALEDFRDAVAADAPALAQAADGRFHESILEAAGQPALREMVRNLDLRFDLGSPLHMWGAPHQQIPMQKKALVEHEAIFAAIRDRERTSAFDLSYRHVFINMDLILELIGED